MAVPRNLARRAHRLGVGDLGCIIFVFLVATLIAFGAELSPYSALSFSPLDALQPPSLAHPFGTDEFGRDVLSRVMHGAAPTLLVALGAALSGVAMGAATGLAAGYFQGTVDEILMRTMDVLMSFPGLILSMLIIVVLGSDPVNVVLALGLVFWPRSARLVRSVAQELAGRGFIEAARSRGESSVFILFRELLPNVLMIVVVDFSLRVTSGILLAASLSYLGVGVSPPTPAWGLMVHDGQPYMELAPWLVAFPCAAIAVVSLGVMLTGERIRRAVELEGISR